MEQLFQDAMACIRIYGKPDLLIIFSINPKWPEILCELEPYQEPNDIPDLISRVFNVKLKALLDEILNKHIFGKVVSHIYVIEYECQKREIQCAHLLICLIEADKVKTIQQINAMVSAETRDSSLDPLAYNYFRMLDSLTMCTIIS